MTDYINIFDTSVYAFGGKRNIMEEKDLGICADISSLRTPEYSVCAAESFQGCPYTDTGFKFDVRLDGERVRAYNNWKWLPNAMLRWGEAESFSVESLTAVAMGKRSFVMKITFTDKIGETRVLPIQLAYRGYPRYEKNWEFPIPTSKRSSLDMYSVKDNILSCESEDAAFYVTSSIENMKCFHTAYLWENKITLPANESVTVYFSVHMGEKETAFKNAIATKENYEGLIESSFNWLKKESSRIEENLPKFESSSKGLNAMYYRSLVSYMLCRWDNPDLCSVPFFSTGSINGGCMCSYLWDYCGGLMLHPLYDAEGNKKNIKAYLKNDLTTSFAITPMGEKYGPWYQINQEKVIMMVYYHVLFTGDKDFLFEEVAGKTIIDWMIEQAYVCDDLSKEVELYNYGEGGSQHLELRRGIVYNGIMPDLNARRYMNYVRAYELTKIAGKPDERMLQRAEALKQKVKTLWNDEIKWYDFINANGEKDVRYTVQMFKFLDSPVIDEEEREGLISHLNEKEFLSKFGLHSMAKHDVAYDQDDIDNGGGGVCSHFTTTICSELYSLGYEELATDILSRVFWWGERMPYMGDSCAANMIMNREDTPLQGNIHAISGAQTILYYLFGITADFEGNITVKPVRVRPADEMKVENVRLCGKVFSVEVKGDEFTVTTVGKSLTSKVGEAVTLEFE